MTKQRESPRVFISASTKDRPLVRVLAEKLRGAGMLPFTAGELKSQRNFLEAVIDELRTSQAVVFLLTPQAIKSPNMLVEAGAAWMSGKPIISVLVGLSTREIPGPLQGFQTIPFDRFDSAVHQLERELATPA